MQTLWHIKCPALVTSRPGQARLPTANCQLWPYVAINQTSRGCSGCHYQPVISRQIDAPTVNIIAGRAPAQFDAAARDVPNDICRVYTMFVFSTAASSRVLQLYVDGPAPSGAFTHYSTALLFASLSMCQSVSCSDLEITTSLTKRAPEPRLSIGVSQDGQKFTRDLTVKSVSLNVEEREEQVNLYINLEICMSIYI